MDKVIIGLSFGLRKDNKPGLSNEDLAAVVDRLQKESHIDSVLQWEIAGLVKKPPLLVVTKHRKPGEYLNTEEVVEQMAEYLKSKNITAVILVAQPFLHRYKCRKLFKKKGFKIEIPKTGWIRFDRKSAQFLGKSPFHALIYAVFQTLFGWEDY